MLMKVFLMANLMLLLLMCHFAQGGLHVGQIVGVEKEAPSPAVAVVASEVPKVRTKRGIFWDFFQKIAITKNLIVDQYTDTRDTLNEIYNMINSQFSDPAPAKPMRLTTTTEKPKNSREDEDDSSESVTTTTEAYVISRYELGRILGRNFRGLQRVAALELKDAFNATKFNLNEYKAEADKQFANSLAVEKKNKLKSLKG